jgi:hypothetical protein
MPLLSSAAARSSDKCTMNPKTKAFAPQPQAPHNGRTHHAAVTGNEDSLL